MLTNINLLTNEELTGELDRIVAAESITDEAEIAELTNYLQFKKYVIYLWLNGYYSGNEVIGKTFEGYIGAETNVITGNLQ